MARKNVFDVSNDVEPPSTETEAVRPMERAEASARNGSPNPAGLGTRCDLAVAGDISTRR